MNMKVLLVDDDETVLYLHKTMARISGLSSDPICFGNGKAAFDYLREQTVEESSYLVLLDINMPVMNGWEFLESIRKMPFAETVSVAMVTSSINNLDRARSEQFSHVVDFIEKPLDISKCNRLKELIP